MFIVIRCCFAVEECVQHDGQGGQEEILQLSGRRGKRQRSCRFDTVKLNIDHNAGSNFKITSKKKKEKLIEFVRKKVTVLGLFYKSLPLQSPLKLLYFKCHRAAVFM